MVRRTVVFCRGGPMWHRCQLKSKYASTVGTWVPSPLVGEGQEEGAHGASRAVGPLSLALSHEGRGDPRAQSRGKDLNLTPMPRRVAPTKRTGGVFMAYCTK